MGKVKSEAIYRRAAEEVKTAILKHLYDQASGNFLKLLHHRQNIAPDQTIDTSSIYGIYNFGVLEATDPRVKRAVEQTISALENPAGSGNVGRYQDDTFYQVNPARGNPWLVTTLWLTQYYIAIAKNNQDLDIVRRYLNWVLKSARPSGVLAEQLHPETGYQHSVAPLVWSHSEFVITVTKYLKKLEDLNLCVECNPVA